MRTSLILVVAALALAGCKDDPAKMDPYEQYRFRTEHFLKALEDPALSADALQRRNEAWSESLAGEEGEFPSAVATRKAYTSLRKKKDRAEAKTHVDEARRLLQSKEK